MFGIHSRSFLLSLKVANNEARGSSMLIVDSTMADAGHAGVSLNCKKRYGPHKRIHVPVRRWLEIKYVSICDKHSFTLPRKKEFHLKKVECTRIISHTLRLGLPCYATLLTRDMECSLSSS